jgi:uncharacterized membrane protein (Fun14 family)
MTGASKEKTESVVQKRIGGTSILSVLYSCAKKIGTVAIVYLIGYFELSVAWLIGPVIFSVIRDEWKKDKELRRNVAKAAAMCNEKDVILARVDDLPSWVSVNSHCVQIKQQSRFKGLPSPAGSGELKLMCLNLL